MICESQKKKKKEDIKVVSNAYAHNAQNVVAAGNAVETFTITLRPLPSIAPPAIRLRRLLKVALRAFGFRCVSVSEAPGNATANAEIPDFHINRGDSSRRGGIK